MFWKSIQSEGKMWGKNRPDLRTVGSVTLFPFTYISAPSHGSRITAVKKNRKNSLKDYGIYVYEYVGLQCASL